MARRPGLRLEKERRLYRFTLADCQFQQAIRRGSTVGLSAEGTSLKSTRASLSILLLPLEIFAVKVRGFREPRVL
jgi:hypothetical protein